MLRLGYISNGFSNHRIEDTVEILAELGYRGLGLSLDTHHLNPFRSSEREVRTFRQRLERLGFEAVIETGARFLLDARRKHYPTLLCREPGKRRDFLKRSIEIASWLGSSVVSLWSGKLPEDEGLCEEEAWDRLLGELNKICDIAAAHGICVGFEPEPGMFIDTMRRFEELRKRLDHRALALTLDLGHVLCTETDAVAEVIRRYARLIVNVHLEDIRGRVHEHLPPGEGEMDFPAVLSALHEIGYGGLVNLELSRNSHDAPIQARRAMDLLGPML